MVANVGVIVALPERTTVVKALVELAKVAFAAGLADHEEKLYPEFAVAVIVVAAPALTVVVAAGVIVPLLGEPGVNVYVTVATVKVDVIVASPVSVTVVDALVALPKVAFAVGLADQPEKVYPEAGVALMAVAAPALTVVAVAGVMVPFERVPGVSM
jgi:hypothetical protein